MPPKKSTTSAQKFKPYIEVISKPKSPTKPRKTAKSKKLIEDSDIEEIEMYVL